MFETRIGIESHIERFVKDSLFRAAQLAQDTELLLTSGRELGAASTARSVLETAGTLMYFFHKFKGAVASGDRGELRKLVSTFLLSSHEFSEEFSRKAPNVMDAIRYTDRRQKSALNAYCVLCEAVHPNWCGRVVVSASEQSDVKENNLRRLMVAISICVMTSSLMRDDYIDFVDFMKKNRKNFKNALLF
jgi:hypothetical protein